MREILWLILTGCLVFACVTDCRSCEVYNFTWWIGGAAAGLLLLTGGREFGLSDIAELVFFIVLQLFGFSKMYGRADCYAFSVCAVAGAAVGMTLMGYLLQMLLAFAFLAVLQGACGNIGRDGNLIKPVPFLPYITLAFWTLLWYHGTVRG